MSQSGKTQNWRDYLPETHGWLSTLALSECDKLQPGALHIVAVKQIGSAAPSVSSVGLDQKISSELKSMIAAKNWNGQSGSLQADIGGHSFLLIPLSTLSVTKPQVGRQFGLDVSKALKEFRPDHLVFCASDETNLEDIVEGFVEGKFNPGLFKSFDRETAKAQVSLPAKIQVLGQKLGNEIKERLVFCQTTALSRMLQEAPANWLNPEYFAEIATDIAKANGSVCNVLGRKELEEKGLGAFLGVASGSPFDPKLIAIEIEGKDPSRTVALIGKGLTFDSGGTSLKPALGMGEMKYDMSGGSAVLGAAYFLGRIKPPTNVVCIIGAVENISGGHAIRPGDVLVAGNKKSIDVQNTDAEGRLVLCDLLHYARTTYKPDFMVDIATLTGAVLHALGHVGAALMSNDKGMAELVLQAAKDRGEPLWQLPIWPEFEKDIKSELADLQNIAGPSVKAGTIIGAAFLQEFVGDTKWAHIDIAGTGWSCRATGYPPAGGSAFGVRTLTEVCKLYGSL